MGGPQDRFEHHWGKENSFFYLDSNPDRPVVEPLSNRCADCEYIVSCKQELRMLEVMSDGQFLSNELLPSYIKPEHFLTGHIMTTCPYDAARRWSSSYVHCFISRVRNELQ
jgi:hypothetical protein